jgi:phosphate transport system permease protein
MPEPRGHPSPSAGREPAKWRPLSAAPGERLVRLGLGVSAALPVLASGALVVLLGVGAWTEAGGVAVPPGGLWPRVVGTLVVAGLATALAVPVGLAIAVGLAEAARPGRLRRWLEAGLELLAGVPSLVYAWLAVAVLGPALQRVVPGLQVPSALVAALVLALMIVPTVSALSVVALRAVPPALRGAALALGASRVRMLRVVVLPAAAPGIGSAVMLALSRALGETMIVTLAAGHVPRTGLDPRVAMETLTGYMGQAALGHAVHASMYTAGAAVLVLSLVAHAGAVWLGRGRGWRWW